MWFSVTGISDQAREDGFHYIGITGNFLLIATAKPLDLQVA
jgi:hypothetical protein